MPFEGRQPRQKNPKTDVDPAMPPPLPFRTKSKSGSSTLPYPLSPSSSKDHTKCDCSNGQCSHCYDGLIVTSEKDGSVYEQLSTSEGIDINSRLSKIEDNQNRLRVEFNQFRNDTTRDIRTLLTSVNEVKELSKTLQNLMSESSKIVQASVSKMHQQLLENSDHLGKQILDVRRDVLARSKKPL